MQSLKVVVVGDGAVGKTCLLTSFSANAFPGDYVPTVFDNYSVNLMHKGSAMALNLWDTAGILCDDLNCGVLTRLFSGQEDYDQLRPLSYPQTDVFLLCFSIISRASFANVFSKWVPELRHYAADVPIVLVGTKSDLRNNEEILQRLAGRKEQTVTREEAMEVVESQKLDAFMEVSALTQQGLAELFTTAIDVALAPRKKKINGKSSKCEIL
jgi:Ras-related C3 botulinum toxin substrate 1